MRSFPPPGARPSRRAVLAGGLLLAGTLAGCGAPREDAGAAAPAAGFPRRVDTALGPVEIPAKPQRIVTVGREAEVVLALDATPVGMPKSYYAPGVEPYLEDRIAGRDVTVFDTAQGIPYEQIAALRPDLVLAGTYYGIEGEVARLSEIAPVVTYRRGALVDTWQDHAALIGEAMGEEQRAAAVVAGLQDRIAGIAAEHPSWRDRTFTLSFNYEAGRITSIVDPADFAMRMVAELGLVPSPGVARLPTSGDAGQADLSYEVVSALDADVLLMAHISPSVQAQLESLPVFAGVPAVREGRYVPVDLITVSVLRAPMVLGIEHALDRLVPELERALG
ncbi:iron-siderophore ABC transporter substrate-binding protein [Pseudonocardia kunmingensis]|uniref:Iron complex transport system substrate-binding protein n=1 Tax=Pseudonocardia kunmingensis TaxID=630975 RepID=A0A543DNG0_9PSEU|nr:iron-siderophore ABC transporter substrate-binding protein [Pseudonocardia kunmingensis]TQM10877.1 iron complex transport system substrate-binding protein [Pseudonocardia kunmingensis]